MNRSNLAVALLCLFLGAGLSEWLSSGDARAQALPPSSGGTSYTHPSAISLSNGIASQDGGTFTGYTPTTFSNPSTDDPAPAVALPTTDGVCFNSPTNTSCISGGSSGQIVIRTPGSITNMTCWGSGVELCDATTLFRFNTTNGARWGTGAIIKTSAAGSATLNFGSIATGNCADLTMTVTGAADGDEVFLGVANAVRVAGSEFDAWVSAADTVTVRHCCVGAATCDPASGTFKARTFGQ